MSVYNKNTMKVGRYSRQKGFTIVELLIVIVVIGILAAITIVAYNGLQGRARDAQRKSDLGTMAKLLNVYAAQENDDEIFSKGSGCGAGGDGNGWWESTESGYPKSTRQCLIDKGYDAASLVDPSGCTGGGPTAPECQGKPRYMIVHCYQGNDVSVFVLAQLESLPRDDAFTDGLCVGGTIYGFANNISGWDTTYGINYAVRVR